ncbi:MAG: type I secretion system permease/ATPase [Hyphomicrobiales bacterium]|nr:type I secretion system permease/ATPase [Hyphomicrobiales bacterium]
MTKVVQQALHSCKSAFTSILLFSLVINLLMLTGSLFMLQIYDRVLPSKSVPTLIALTILIIVLYSFMGGLEFIRSRLLVRIGLRLDDKLSRISFKEWLSQSIKIGHSQKKLPLNDLKFLRQFLSGPGPVSLFDMPWVPIYLFIIFMFHFYLGLLATAGAIIVFSLALINEFSTKTKISDANIMDNEASAFANLAHRNAQSITAMGMQNNIESYWYEKHKKTLSLQTMASDKSGALTSVSKMFRMFLQSAVLAVGAWLAIEQEITPGTMIAASIIMGRALTPIDQAIGQWKGFVTARNSYKQLKLLFAQTPMQMQKLELPVPVAKLEVSELYVRLQPQNIALLENINFSLNPGQALGIIGASASGKSTLAKAIVGIVELSNGSIRIDGSTLNQWDMDELGKYLGYLPQNIELLNGTVKQNIARFDPSATDEEIVAAAKNAYVHDVIKSMPNGYETEIGEAGAFISGGQKQRVALARALFRDPKIIVLDEPNANLDSEGDIALTKAIKGIRERGNIAIVLTHRPSAIASVDMLLMIKDGRQSAFGPKDKVLKQVTQPKNKKIAGVK